MLDNTNGEMDNYLMMLDDARGCYKMYIIPYKLDGVPWRKTIKFVLLNPKQELSYTKMTYACIKVY
jgi:hypothetical protein